MYAVWKDGKLLVEGKSGASDGTLWGLKREGSDRVKELESNDIAANGSEELENPVSISVSTLGVVKFILIISWEMAQVGARFGRYSLYGRFKLFDIVDTDMKMSWMSQLLLTRWKDPSTLEIMK